MLEHDAAPAWGIGQNVLLDCELRAAVAAGKVRDFLRKQQAGGLFWKRRVRDVRGSVRVG